MMNDRAINTMPMKNVITLLALLTLTYSAFAQAPPVQWQRSLGGSLGEELFDIQHTLDGGYVMTGYTTSSNGDVTLALGEEDVWVVKLDSTGTMEWERSYGGSEQDIGHSIKQTPDGGYIVAGKTWSSDGDVTSNHGDFDLWVLRLDNNGNLQWERNLGGPFKELGGYTAVSTSGDFFVAGSSKSLSGDLTSNNGDFDIWIVKLDMNGSLIWEHSFGGSEEDFVMGICSTSDGGVIASGYSYSENGDLTTNLGFSDAWLIKLAANGDIDWKRTYGGTQYDSANDIQQTTEGGYIVAGSSYSNDGDLTSNNGGWDMWVFKLDPSGDIQWQTSFGGTSLDVGMSVSQTTDGGYIVAGHSDSNNGDFPINQGEEDTWILRLDPAGALLWQRSFGGSTYDWAAAVQQTTDGGYILGGTTFSTNGDVLFNNGFTDLLVVKFAASDPTMDITTSTELAQPIRLLPNPVQDHLVLEFDLEGPAQLQLRLFNAVGQEFPMVLDELRHTGAQRINIPVQHLGSGIYHLHLRIDDRTFVRKWVKM